jgi:hypothetical protein
MVPSCQNSVERTAFDGDKTLVNVQTSLFFESHAETYARVFRELRPRSPLPEIRVEFRSTPSISSSIELRNGNLTVKIADLLEGAPAPVSEALAYILLSKLFKNPVPRVYSHRYRLWLNRKDVRRTMHLIRQTRGKKRMLPPVGVCFDLEKEFEELNKRFFHGLLARPALGWSRARSRTRLGHYDPSHNAIVISRVFDQPAAPRIAFEYVLFHEMLHLRYPEQNSGSRRRIHTEEFREAEKTFPDFEEAKKALKELLRCTHLPLD